MTPKEIADVLEIRTLESFFGREWLFWFTRLEDVKAFSELCTPKYRRWLVSEQTDTSNWVVRWYVGDAAD